MIDVGIISGSGIYELSTDGESRVVESRFGNAEVSIFRAGPWTVGSISRHQKNHRHLPHTIPHQAHLMALRQLGARAVLATTVVGAVDPGVYLGRPVLFDDLFFPTNLLPNGAECTIFTEPGDPKRGHLIWNEPFAPRLRRKLELATGALGLEAAVGGVYGHTNGPRFESRTEIRWLASAGVTAVSQTCGPEAILAGELELPYALVGFPVNYATGVSQSRRRDLDRLLALSAEVLPRVLLRTVETLEEEDLAFDYGYIYRVEGGVGPRKGLSVLARSLGGTDDRTTVFRPTARERGVSMRRSRLDLATIKERQRRAWAAGDYAMFGSAMLIMSELLCEAVDLRPGQTVLDVATGSGNTALAAARRFGETTAIDYVPALLERGRERAAAELLEVTFREGDAESVPFPDASFDVVLSTVGVMFAPDQEKAAAELLRVCRPGGRIGLTSWTPDSFAGEQGSLFGKYLPFSPGLKQPVLWGTEERLRELLGGGARDLRIARRSFVFRYRSVPHYLEVLQTQLGPTRETFLALDPARRENLVGELVDLIGRSNRSGDETMVVPSDYLEVVVTRI